MNNPFQAESPPTADLARRAAADLNHVVSLELTATDNFATHPPDPGVNPAMRDSDTRRTARHVLRQLFADLHGVATVRGVLKPPPLRPVGETAVRNAFAYLAAGGVADHVDVDGRPLLCLRPEHRCGHPLPVRPWPAGPPADPGERAGLADAIGRAAADRECPAAAMKAVAVLSVSGGFMARPVSLFRRNQSACACSELSFMLCACADDPALALCDSIMVPHYSRPVHVVRLSPHLLRAAARRIELETIQVPDLPIPN